MTDEVDNFLAHYGVKGMRWGVRRGRGTPTARGSKESSGSDSQQSRSPGRVKRGAQNLKSKWDNLDPETRDIAKGITLSIVAGAAGKVVSNLATDSMPEMKRAQSFTEHFMSGGDTSRPAPMEAKIRRGAYVTTTLKR